LSGFELKHTHAPKSKIIFNSLLPDTDEAVKRWLQKKVLWEGMMKSTGDFDIRHRFLHYNLRFCGIEVQNKIIATNMIKMKRLAGKVSVITGAGSGMGKAMALLFAEEGAAVVVADVNQQAIEQVVSDITAKGQRAKGVVANVAIQEDIDRMISTAVSEFGSLDVLVNNAGILDNFKTVGELEDELWNRIMDVNLTGPFKTSRAAIRIMEKQESGGVIINNASVGGLFGSRGGAAYVASKHGLIGLTRNMAATYGLYGNIRVNAIAPGGVDTSIQSSITAPSELGMKALNDTGFAPLGKPEQLAYVALFLASDESSFVNGEVIAADGGWTAR